MFVEVPLGIQAILKRNPKEIAFNLKGKVF